MTRRRFIRTFSAAAFLPSARAEEPVPWARSEPHMGCLWTLTLPDTPPETAEKASADVFSEIARLNRIFSDYEPASELNLLCGKAGQDQPVAVSPELFDILQRSLRMADFSGGLFDITLAPCVRLWRRSRRRGELPDAESLGKARALTGWQNMELDETRRTVRLTKPGMQLDLGGIAKGWTQDACLGLLRERHHITCCLLDAAGEVAAGTPPPGRAFWQIGLHAVPGGKPSRIPLKEGNAATSGDHYLFVEIGGRRYSHIIDPRTGLGSTISRQGTIIAPTGAAADPLTKLICLMEPVGSLALLAERFPEVQALVSEYRPDQPPRLARTPGFPATVE